MIDCSRLSTALQISRAAHFEVAIHVLPRERAVEELVVTAADILRDRVGDVLMTWLPLDAVAQRRHPREELFA